MQARFVVCRFCIAVLVQIDSQAPGNMGYRHRWIVVVELRVLIACIFFSGMSKKLGADLFIGIFIAGLSNDRLISNLSVEECWWLQWQRIWGNWRLFYWERICLYKTITVFINWEGANEMLSEAHIKIDLIVTFCVLKCFIC